MYLYRPEWHDMSNYAVHFTRAGENRTAYDNIMSILYLRVLHAVNPFGYVRHLAPNVDTQRAFSFSEIPLHLLQRIAQEKGNYGIGFLKQFLLERGGSPIWFVEQDSDTDNALQMMVDSANDSPDPGSHPVWTITPFIDRRMSNYRFEWEREWRHIGDMHFTEQDVTFLIIPEHQHGDARIFFEGARRENYGPGYLCPYIDVGWSLERIQETLAQRDQGAR